MSTQSTLVSASVAAAMLGVTTSHLYHLVHTKRLKRARPRGFLFRPADVIRLRTERKTWRRARPTVEASVAKSLQEMTT